MQNIKDSNSIVEKNIEFLLKTIKDDMENIQQNPTPYLSLRQENLYSLLRNLKEIDKNLFTHDQDEELSDLANSLSKYKLVSPALSMPSLQQKEVKHQDLLKESRLFSSTLNSTEIISQLNRLYNAGINFLQINAYEQALSWFLSGLQLYEAYIRLSTLPPSIEIETYYICLNYGLKCCVKLAEMEAVLINKNDEINIEKLILDFVEAHLCNPEDGLINFEYVLKPLTLMLLISDRSDIYERISTLILNHTKDRNLLQKLIDNRILYEIARKHLPQKGINLNFLTQMIKLFSLNPYENDIFTLQGMPITAISWWKWRQQINEIRHQATSVLSTNANMGLLKPSIEYQKCLITIFKDIGLWIQKRLGPPPAHFTLLGLGSWGREDFSLHSDIDIALLIDSTDINIRQHTYFKAFIHLFSEFSKLISYTQRIHLHPHPPELIFKGPVLDLGFIQKVIDMEGAPCLKQQPEKLAMWLTEKLQIENADDKNLQSAYALLSAKPIYSSFKNSDPNNNNNSEENELFTRFINAVQINLFGQENGLAKSAGKSLTLIMQFLTPPSGIQAQTQSINNNNSTFSSLFFPQTVPPLHRLMALYLGQATAIDNISSSENLQKTDLKTHYLTPLLRQCQNLVLWYGESLLTTSSLTDLLSLHLPINFMKRLSHILKTLIAHRNAGTLPETSFLKQAEAFIKFLNVWPGIVFKAAAITSPADAIYSACNEWDWTQTLLMLTSSTEHINTPEVRLTWYAPYWEKNNKNLTATRIYLHHSCILKSEYTELFFTHDGHLKPEAKLKDGRNYVVCLRDKEGYPLAYLKFYPEAPGVQAQTEGLVKRLSGYQANSTLARLYHPQLSEPYPVLLSQPQGQSIRIYLREYGQLNELEDQLDPAAFTWKIIENILLKLEDDKDDNLALALLPRNHLINSSTNSNLLSPTSRYYLASFDGDHAFVDAIVPAAKKDHEKINIKNLVYCFKAMQKQMFFNRLVIESFNRINPYLLLNDWLIELKELSKNWEKPTESSALGLFSKTLIQKYADKKENFCFIPMAFVSATTKDLYQSFYRLRNFFSKNELETINLLRVLEYMEPQLATHYTCVLNSPYYFDPKTRFDALPTEFEIQQEGSLIVQRSNFNIAQHAQQNLTNINQRSSRLNLRQMLAQDSIEKPTINNCDSAYEELADIHLRYTELDDYLKDTEDNQAQKWLSLKNADLIKERVVKSLIWEKLNVPSSTDSKISIAVEILKGLAGTYFRQLIIKNCSILTSNLLIPLLEKSPELQVLNLTGCSQLNEEFFKTIAEKNKHLENLILSSCAIKKIESAGRLSNVSALFLPKLKFLFIEQCPSLIRINVITPLLEKLVIQTCDKLADLQIETLTLNEICLTNCDSLPVDSILKLLAHISQWRVFPVIDKDIPDYYLLRWAIQLTFWNSALIKKLMSTEEKLNLSKSLFNDHHLFALTKHINQPLRILDIHYTALSLNGVMQCLKTWSSLKQIVLTDWRTSQVKMLTPYVEAAFTLITIDEQHIAIACKDNQLRIRNVLTGEIIKSLKGHTGDIYALLKLRDGRLLSASFDKTIKLWDLNDKGQCVKTFRGHSEAIRSLVQFNNGLIASGSWDCTIKLWDLKGKGECLRTLLGHHSDVNTLVVLNDEHLISGSNDHTLKLWDIISGQCLKIFQGHEAGISAVTISSEGHLISGSYDNTLKIWDIKNGQILKTFNDYTAAMNSLITLPNGFLASNTRDHTLKIWNLNSGQSYKILNGDQHMINGLTLLNDGRIVTVGLNDAIKIWSWNPLPVDLVSINFIKPHIDYKLIIVPQQKGDQLIIIMWANIQVTLEQEKTLLGFYKHLFQLYSTTPLEILPHAEKYLWYFMPATQKAEMLISPLPAEINAVSISRNPNSMFAISQQNNLQRDPNRNGSEKEKQMQI